MEEMELPAGWSIISLSDAGHWGSGGTPSRKHSQYYGGDIPWIKTGELGPRTIIKAEEYITEFGLANSSAKIFQPGSVAIAMYGATIGKVSILGIPAATNQACAVAEVDERVTTSDFLFHYLCSQRDQFAQAGKGGAQPNISQGLLKGWRLPLPPLNEQRRIAAKLDTTLAAVDACRQRLDGVAELLKRFRQAVLTAATSGELTREWREERGAPEWDTKSLGDCGAVTGGITKNSSRLNMPLQKPYLRVANVYLNRIDLDDVSVIGVTEAEYRKTALHSGDLLIVEGNGSLQQVGRVAIWEEADFDCVHQNHLIRWRSEEMMPKWALYWLMSPVGRQLLEQRAKSTTGLHTLSVSKVSRISIPVPSISEQDEIICRVQDLFTLADQLEARLSTARKVVDRLTPALLAKAFRGELVPQDPSDEPASVLLERLRAARQAEAGAAKPSRRGRRKAAVRPDQPSLDAAPVPSDLLSTLLQECGALSERALLAASELEPRRFRAQLQQELQAGWIREEQEDGEKVLVSGG